MKIRKGDTVKVLSGDHRGEQGTVLKVDREKRTVLVQGVNRVWKHLRRSVEYPHGARIEKEAPLQIAKVEVVCPNCGKPTRVGFTHAGTAKDAPKMRQCRHCKKPFTSNTEEKA